MKRLAIALCIGAAASSFGQHEAPAGQEQRGPVVRMNMSGTAGTITAVKGDTITVKTLDGREATVKVGDKTVFRKDQKEAKLADFKAGDMIFVRGEPGSDGSYAAQSVISRSDLAEQMRAGGGAFMMGAPGGPGGGGQMQALSEGMGKQFIVGEVKSVDGLKLTIERIDKQTQTIEVDENTSFRRQRESITLADIKPGDRIFGRGALNKDGVFVPATLNVGDFPMMIQQRPAPAPKQ